ncbi:hypothetical protein LTR85_009718 [Meristemomyces frigidus]|nr:hypothetical protein LTR85_009718 [Meristemomyces frigidus]
MSTKQDGNTFTARDFELLAAAMECTKAPIEVDYKLFAEKVGFKGAPSAKASWNTLKKKLAKFNASGGSVAPSLTITAGDSPERGGKKRKATDDDDGSGSEVETEPAATKSKKKGRKAPLGGAKGKVAAAPVEQQEEDQDDDEELPASGMKKDKGTKREPSD